MSVNELLSPQTVDRPRETRAATAKALARYTSLLVHVETESTASDARVTLAVDLARRFGAALIGVAAEAPQPPPGDAYGGLAFIGDVFEEEERQIRLDLEAARNRFEALTHATELELEWRSSIDNPAQTLSREARSADLILVGRDLSRLRAAGVYRSADPGDLLMEAGRPLLVVPPGASSLVAERIVVAWKDAREARRAIWDALPFLTRATSVHVVEVTADADLQAAARRVLEVSAYLKRHGVQAEAEARSRREASDADELILVAEQNNADLIVAGAYGHARFREWIFGGVTADLLRHCPKCCLLSH